MAFDFDSGPQGSEGPWFNWSARGTQDGAIPARTFYINDADKNKTPVDASKGIILDIENMKTGWQSGGGVGVAPDWVLGASPGQFPARPNEDAKKGFQIPVAVGGGKVAQWNQAGAGAWGAVADIGKALVDGSKSNPGKLPVIVHDGVKELKFKMGSTSQPLLKVVKWVDRPDCLKPDAGVADGFDTGQDTPPPDNAALSEDMTF